MAVRIIKNIQRKLQEDELREKEEKARKEKEEADAKAKAEAEEKERELERQKEAERQLREDVNAQAELLREIRDILKSR